MFPRLALICAVLALGAFAVGLSYRLRQLSLGASRDRTERVSVWVRVRRLTFDGFGQRRVLRKPQIGILHAALFLGFVLLLPRTVIVCVRAFIPGFASIATASSADCVALLGVYEPLVSWTELWVLLVVATLGALRLGRFLPRLRPTASALGILGAIAGLMVADRVYDAAGATLGQRFSVVGVAATSAVESELAYAFALPFAPGAAGTAVGRIGVADPMTAILGSSLASIGTGGLLVVGLAAYALHWAFFSVLLVILPHTKHLHLLLVWPKLFFDGPSRLGRVEPIATSTDELLERVEASAGGGPPGASRPLPIGRGSLADFSIRERLEWYACTACGRCSDVCPATRSGRALDPRQLTWDLRRHLERLAWSMSESADSLALPIVPNVVTTEALWSCTNCGACEEQCPIGVRTPGTILGLRRHALLIDGRAPRELQRTFAGIERQGNPWNLPSCERSAWAEGLGVQLLKDVEAVEYLYWVGCAASYDERVKAVARSLVRLMQRANVSFAILGNEEHCTGEAARRAGNELLFIQLAERNVALLNQYQAAGRFRKIITACPHCLLTLRHEYPEFGGKYDVVAHVDALLDWVSTGRLVMRSRSAEVLTYHDPCTLARSMGNTEAPRRLLARLPSARLVEPRHSGSETACCGAGGAQMWLSDQPSRRTSEGRFSELMSTQADHLLSACPHCLTMLEAARHHAPSQRALRLSDLAEVVERWLDPAPNGEAAGPIA